MFVSGYEAIGWAIRRLRTPIYQSPSIWRMARKTGYRDSMPGMTPWDKVAEAALIMRIIDRQCRPHQRAAIMAYFTGGASPETGGLIEWVARDMAKDRWFVLEVTLNWAKGTPTKHSQRWWARKYGVGQSSVQRWSEGVKKQLENSFSTAVMVTEEALIESGHVERK